MNGNAPECTLLNVENVQIRLELVNRDSQCPLNRPIETDDDDTQFYTMKFIQSIAVSPHYYRHSYATTHLIATNLFRTDR